MKSIRLSVRPISLAVALSFVGGAYAVGSATIVSGSGSISKGNSEVVIKQNTDKMIVNWDNMNVGKNEKLRFNQPGATSAVLNRINGINPTMIQGALNANGRVFIVNPNGVLIGNGAAINVGSLVASSLDIKNADFNSENYHFTGTSNGKVVNEGMINASGSVGLIGAGEVINSGNITSGKGNVNLAAGSDITLSFPTFGKMDVKINQGSLKALVNNGGIVVAKGGNVMLTAWATDHLTRGVINNTGVLEATGLAYDSDGSVSLISQGNENGSINAGGAFSSGFTQSAGVMPSPAQGKTILRSSSGNINLSGQLRGDRLNVSARNIKMANSATVDIKQYSTLAAREHLALAGNISGGESLELTSNNTLSQAAGSNISASRYVSYHGKNIALNGDVKALRVAVMAKDSAFQGQHSSINATYLTLNGGHYDLSAGDNNASQVSVRATSLNMSSASDVKFIDDSRIDNDFTLSGAKNVEISNLTVFKSANIKAGSDLTITQGLRVDGDAVMRASNITDDHFGNRYNNVSSIGGKAELNAKNNIDLGYIRAGMLRKADLVLSAKRVEVVKKSASNNVIINASELTPIHPVAPIDTGRPFWPPAPIKPTNPIIPVGGNWSVSPPSPIDLVKPNYPGWPFNPGSFGGWNR